MIDLDAVVACVAAGIYGDDRMSPRERDGALASLSALVEEVKRLEAENASLVQTSADLCAECGWRFFVPGDGCQKCELDRLREDAVVAHSVETTLTVEVERLRTNAAARERFLRREGDLLRAAERERDDLRARLRVTAQILIAAVGADGPMNAEDAARKAVAEVERLRTVVADLTDMSDRLDAQAVGMTAAFNARDAEVERLRAEVAWLRTPVRPDETCASCGCARFRHEQWRVDGAYKTKCWGGGYDLDDCGCSQFVRLTHDGRKP